MAKVGHSFGDFVTLEKGRSPHHGGFSLVQELLRFFPIVIVAIIFAVLLVRLFYVQIIRGSYYQGLSDQNRMRTAIIPAARGIIFDRNGVPLVRNSPAFKILENGKVHFITHDEALNIEAKNPKTQIYADIERDYLYKTEFAHVLGYIGQVTADELLLPQYQNYSITDLNGKLGLEQQYELILHGRNGHALYEVDAQGKLTQFLGREEPIPGQDVHTTLDVTIQKAVAESFADDQKGAAIVSDPQDGSILAMYSNPSFDPNVFTHPKNYDATGKYKTVQDILTNNADTPFLNRAIAGAYPPGSTFKLITATAALETHSVTADTAYEDTGVLKVAGYSFANWYYTDYGGMDGSVNVVKAIKRSNDIYFYQAAAKTGPNIVAKWAQKFGMGSKLGIDLPGEITGTVPTTDWKKQEIGEQWYLGDTYHMGIGQGYDLATPLQVNTWTTPFANGGYIYQPHLVQNHESRIMNHDFISPSTISLVREGMKEACAPGGVAWPLFNFKVKNPNIKIDNLNYTHSASDGAQMVQVALGCKTGTAETDGGSKPDAWITVFAPFYNPEIVATVLVENSGEGSNIAGPIVKNILTKYFEGKK